MLNKKCKINKYIKYSNIQSYLSGRVVKTQLAFAKNRLTWIFFQVHLYFIVHL